MSSPPVVTVRVLYLSCGCVRWASEFEPALADGSPCPGCRQATLIRYFENRHVWRP